MEKINVPLSNLDVDDDKLDAGIKKITKKVQDKINEGLNKIKINVKDLDIDLSKINIKGNLNLKDIKDSSDLLKQYSQNLNDIISQYDTLKATYPIDVNTDTEIKKIIEEPTNQIEAFKKEIADFQNSLNAMSKDVYSSINDMFSGNLTNVNSLSKTVEALQKISEAFRDVGVVEFDGELGIALADAEKATSVFEGMANILKSGAFNSNAFAQISTQIQDLGANASQVGSTLENFLNLQSTPGALEAFTKLEDEIRQAQSLLKTGSFDTSSFESIRKEIVDTEGELKNLGLSLTDINTMLKNQGTTMSKSIKGELTKAITTIQDSLNGTVNGIKDSSGKVGFSDTYANVFKGTQDAADQCKEHIDGLLVSEKNASTSLQKYFDENQALSGFVVSIKRANGEVEKLNYTLDESDFKLQKMSTNDIGIDKQAATVEREAKSMESALAQFNASTAKMFEGTDLFSGVSKGIEQLRKGEITIDELKNRFESLKASSKDIESILSGSSKSFDRYANATNDIKQYGAVIDDLSNKLQGFVIPPETSTSIDDLRKQLSDLQKSQNLDNADAVKVWAENYIKLKDNIAQVNKEINEFQKTSKAVYDINNLSNVTSITGKDENDNIISFTGNVKDAEQALQELFVSAQNLQVKGINDAQDQAKQLTVRITEADGAVKEFSMSLAQIKVGDNIVSGLVQDSDVKVIKTATDAQEKYNKVQEKTASLLTKYSSTSNIQQNNMLMFGTWDSTSINNMRKAVDEYESIVSTLRNAYQEDTGTFDQSLLGNIDLTKVNQQLSSLSTTISKLMSEIKNQVGGGSLATIIGNLDIDKYKDQLDAFSNSIANIGKGENKTALDNAKLQLQGIVAEMEKAAESNDFDTMNTAAKKFNSTLEEANNTLNSINNSGGGSIFGKVINGITSGYQTLTKIIGAGFVTRELRSIAKEMVNTVTEIDEAMAQLQIVTGATSSEMKDFLESSTKLAKELGQSITDVLSSVETYSRLGYNLEEASSLAEFTAILSNVASVDMEEATTGLTSVIKGFGMAVDDVEHVSDVLVNIGQNYAVSAGEILEAFEKSSAALAATGTTFEESAAIIAAGNAAVQDASTVGTALKTNIVFVYRNMHIVHI